MRRPPPPPPPPPRSDRDIPCTDFLRSGIGLTPAGLIVAKAVLLSAALFRWPDPAEQVFLPSMLFDLAVLGTLYFAVLTRSQA